jgi:hypothetical protein
MLQIEGGLEAAVRRAAARADVAPEAFVAQLLELGLAQMEAALGQSALEPDQAMEALHRLRGAKRCMISFS